MSSKKRKRKVRKLKQAGLPVVPAERRRIRPRHSAALLLALSLGIGNGRK